MSIAWRFVSFTQFLHTPLYIIRCNQKPLLVLLVCLCKIFQRTLSLVAKRSCISQKRVQKYKQFSIPPNISRKKFVFTLLFNTYKQLIGISRLSSPILAKRQGIPFNAEKNHFYLNSATLWFNFIYKFLSNKKLLRILPCQIFHLS